MSLAGDHCMQRDGTLGFVRQSLLCIHSHLVCYTEASERAPLLLLNHAPPLARLPCQDGAPGEQLDLWAAPCGCRNAPVRSITPCSSACQCWVEWVRNALQCCLLAVDLLCRGEGAHQTALPGETPGGPPSRRRCRSHPAPPVAAATITVCSIPLRRVSKSGQHTLSRTLTWCFSF